MTGDVRLVHGVWILSRAVNGWREDIRPKHLSRFVTNEHHQCAFRNGLPVLPSRLFSRPIAEPVQILLGRIGEDLQSHYVKFDYRVLVFIWYILVISSQCSWTFSR